MFKLRVFNQLTGEVNDTDPARHAERFLNPLDLSHVSVLKRAHRKGLDYLSLTFNKICYCFSQELELIGVSGGTKELATAPWLAA